MIIIVSGVSGTGKTTIGERLAERLELPFYDADHFHPEANVQKMKNGIALNDEDRQPWLLSLSKQLSLWESGVGAVLACSALKSSYRQTLMSNCKNQPVWIVLHGSRDLLKARIESRKGHYFNPKLLDSQLDTLELPDYGWIIDVAATPEEIVQDILKRLADKSMR